MSPRSLPEKTLSPSYQSVLDILQKRTGLIFPKTRLGEIADLVDKAAQLSKLSVEQYADQLAYNSALFDELCSQVTVAETYFFRDPKQFEFVKKEVLPAWRAKNFATGNKNNASFRAWSAGCSTGEEAYSLAILLEQEGLGQSLQVTGSDISKQALAAAAKAQYSPWSLRTSDQRFCNTYFDQKDGKYNLHQKYCSRVRFLHLNLADDITVFTGQGLADLDLILCRNVLIYFDGPSIAAVMQRLYALLKPGGYLVLGPSDPSANQSVADFQMIVSDWGVYFKKPEATPPPVPTPTSPAAALPSTSPRPLPAKHAMPHRKHQAVINKLPQSKGINTQDRLGQANTAYSRGQYEKAFDLTGSLLADPAAAILHIKALANFSGSAPAEKVLKKLLEQHIGSFHLQYLHGHLLMDLGQSESARAALKRCLFIDSKATMAHFSLALVQKSLGDNAGASRSFRNVVDLCQGRPDDEVLPFGDGVRVKILASQAAAELAALST